MYVVKYVVNSSGVSPVKTFIDSLEIKQKRKVFHIFLAIQSYGLESIKNHIKKVINTPFYELRVLGSDNIRIFYFVRMQGEIILLHAYIKKTKKIPSKELYTTYRAYRQFTFDK